jgi:Trp operon repressor
MKGEVDNVINIPTSLKGKFFKYWFKFLLPFHGLTDREMDVAAAFLLKRYELSKVISDVNILNTVLMNEDTKREIRDMISIGQQHFQVILSKLRKTNIIIDNRINPRFIPNVKEENGNFKLLLLFSFTDEKSV